MKNFDSSEKEKKNTSNSKKHNKDKKVMESENNLQIVKIVPTKLKQNRKGSTKITTQSNTYDFYDDETQDTDDSLYLPNFAKNFDGNLILIYLL